MSYNCKNKFRCEICKQKHHTLLHDKKAENHTEKSETPMKTININLIDNEIQRHTISKPKEGVILTTAMI